MSGPTDKDKEEDALVEKMLVQESDEITEKADNAMLDIFGPPKLPRCLVTRVRRANNLAGSPKFQ